MENICFDSKSIDNDAGYDVDKRLIWNVMIRHCILFGMSTIVNQSYYIARLTIFTPAIQQKTDYSKLILIIYNVFINL